MLSFKRSWILTTLLGFLILSSCAAPKVGKNLSTDGKVPGWIDHPYDSYPASRYIVGVGSGDTRANAENNAIGSISKVFQSKVSVDETVLQNYYENKQGVTANSEIINKTNIKSGQALKNITIDKSYYSSSEGLYYVLAYLNRLDTEDIYQQEIEENYKLVSDYYYEYKTSENKLVKFAYLMRASDLMDVNELLLSQFKIISVTGETIEAPVPVSQIMNEKVKLLSMITVRLNPDGGQSENAAAYLKQVIGKIGFKIVEDQRADFDINYRFTFAPASLGRNDVSGNNWQLALDIKDNINQFTLKTFTFANRTMGISEDQAYEKMMTALKKELDQSFYKQFIEYIRSI
ncbi:MAG: LPP20 family lipoprotein [Calditrichaceae bacterium]